MIEMTCKNHHGARYLTKGPGHSLFFAEADPEVVAKVYPNATEEQVHALRYPHAAVECPCPESDLVEVPKEDSND